MQHFNNLSRYDFLQVFGREPRMTGPVDVEEYELLIGRFDLFEVTCLGDDIRSFVMGRAIPDAA